MADVAQNTPRHNGAGYDSVPPTQFSDGWTRGPLPALVARCNRVWRRIHHLQQRLVLQIEDRTSTGRRHGYPRTAIPNTMRKLNYAYRELRRIENGD
jgi:hypothetical protein